MIDLVEPRDPLLPRPAAGVAVRAYHVPRHPAPTDLVLDGNEGEAPPAALLDELSRMGPEVLRRYPDPGPLEALLAARHGVAPEGVLVTAGADDALSRLCLSVLSGGRAIVLPVPTFEMIDRFARVAGGEVRTLPWVPGEPYPTEAVVAAMDDATTLVAIVSPNNPTGGVATAADLRRVAAAARARRALVALDHAYVEFADEDLTGLGLSLGNVVVFRTLSKAWGLAGARIGYAIGPAEVIGWMRAAGCPYSASRPSLALAASRIARGEADVAAFVARVRDERARLSARIAARGARAFPSGGNFVFARFPDASWVRDAMAGLGISVREFPGKAGLEGTLRITCPGDEAAYARVEAALDAALAPEAILFDMDGVLADVSGSYREAIRAAAASFGVDLSFAEIAAAKAEPGSNNDWVTTRRLLARRGVHASLEDVTARFEAAYQGTAAAPGLWTTERLLPGRDVLERLAARVRLGIVTGRPRHDAERFLAANGLADLFGAVVCMEDAPLKPDPAPVRLAMARLGATRGWMVGDAPDDLRAARAAGVVPLGLVAPGDEAANVGAALWAAGAARVLDGIAALLVTGTIFSGR